MRVEDALEDFLIDVTKESKKNLVKKGKVSSKELFNSIDYDIKVNKNSYSASVSMADHGEFIDKGVRGAGGVRKTTSKFLKRNNKGKLWKIKGKGSKFKFGKSGGISPKHFAKWAKSKGLNKFAVAKAVYHQGIETTNFYSEPFEKYFKNLPDELIEAYSLDLDNVLTE